MGGLTWLHLSDWHQNGNDINRQIVRDRLIDDIQNRVSINNDLEKIDFIVFSGDIAWSGKTDEYERAKTELFEPLIEACDLDPKRLFIVPGNHDLDTSKIPSRLLAPLESNDDTNYWLSNGNRLEALRPLRNFSDFVSEYTKQETPDFASIRNWNINGRDVSLIGIDSAWMCCRRKNASGKFDDKGVVVVGESQIYNSLKTILKSNIKIAVLHHHFDWLAEFEWSQIVHRLMEECNFVLFGHRHESEVEVIRGTIGDCIIIPGGACYFDRQYHNSYNFVHLDFESKKGIVFLRCWNGRNRWREDIDLHPNGMYPFELTSSVALVEPLPNVDRFPAMIAISKNPQLQGSTYSTIQDAVNAANPDDTIKLAEGTFKENVYIDKPLTIIGSGKDKTIVDGDQAGSVFIIGCIEINDINVFLQSLTIKGGIGTEVLVINNSSKTHIAGGGILNYGRLTVTECTIFGNTAYYGGGILNKGIVNLNNGTSIIHNIAYEGGGLFNSDGEVNLCTCSIEDNKAAMNGAGIYSGGCIVRRNIVNMHRESAICGNFAENSGGGIWIILGRLNMHGGKISNNKGWTGGGIYCHSSNANLNGGYIYNNMAMNGAGVVNGGGEMILNGTRIHSNTANKNNYGIGGGIHANNAEKMSGNKLLVHHNSLIDGTPDDISFGP